MFNLLRRIHSTRRFKNKKDNNTMKKFMTFALVAAFAVGAQAATIVWGLGADVYLMQNGDFSTAAVPYETTITPVSGSYLALVYVGQNQDSFDIANITQDSVLATSAYALDTDGLSFADWDPYTTTTQVSASTYADGASFSVVWYDAGSGKFDYVYSIDDGSALNSATTLADMTRGSDSINIAENTNGFGGVINVTVPEPGIAAMALIGLGMMIKRRRA